MERRHRLLERVLDLAAPLTERDRLLGRAANLVERGRVFQARLLPSALRHRLTLVERLRTEATLARIVSSAGERDCLRKDADLYVAHLLQTHLQRSPGRGAPSFPFLFAVGPVGSEGVFWVPRRDVEDFAREAASAWKLFERVVRTWGKAKEVPRREAVGLFVEAVAQTGSLCARRCRPRPKEEEHLERILRMLDGHEPAAMTDGEVAISLCRAYFIGVRLCGAQAEAEIDPAGEGTGRDA
jgi:hypothetical protein